MNFKEFVDLTRPVIGGKGGIQKYVRSLFDAILIEEEHDILEGYSESSYKAYGNGNTQITEISKAMVSYLDTVEFASFIYDFGDSAQLELCERFRAYLPGINACNVGEEIADLFAAIIRDAAGAKRKSPAPPKDDAGTIEADVADDDVPSGAAEENKKITIIQNQTNVVQNGENNFNLTNNGTMNFNF